MKKKIIALAVTLLALSACSLDETPYGVYSNKTFFLTDADAESALMYAYLPINYIEYAQRFMFYLGDDTTDELVDYGRGGGTNVSNWDIRETSEEMLYYFKTIYVALGRANSVLENVPGMNISQEKKNKYLGEAYFLRAYHHFNLVINWGSVPLRTSTANTMADTQSPRASIQQLWEQIINDLESAEGLLGINKLQGRTDVVAAQALLSRAYLYLASYKATGSPGYEWVKDADAMYAKAVEYADKVIYQQTVYSLEPRLENIYSVYHQGDCPEHIFITGMSREASGAEGTFSQLPLLWMIQYNDEYIYVSESLVPETDPQTGKVKVMKMMNCRPAWEALRVNYQWRDATFDDGDLRKQLMVTTIYTEEGDVLRTYSPDNINSKDILTNKYFFPFCRKYSDPISNEHRGSANMYLIRMGEIYLNYAEAAGPTKNGYDCVNAIRERAGLGKLPEGLDVEKFREAVRLERQRELCFEGHALYDFRRLHRVDAAHITKVTPRESIAYFFPFPQRETDLNLSIQ